MLTLAGVYVVYTYLRPILSQQLNFSASAVTIILFVYGFMSLISNQLSGRLANHNGLAKMPKVFTIEGVILLLLPFALFNRITGLLVLMALGVCMYLHNSPVQMHFLAVAEADYPQSMVMASSLNSIFANFGIALGSATGGLVVDHFGLAATGFGGAIYLAITLVVVIWLNRINQQHQQSHQ